MHGARSTFLIVALAVIALSGCSEFRASEARIARGLEDVEVTPSFAYLSDGDRTIRYRFVGEKAHPRVLFIHGAPGSLDAFNPYFELPELRERAQLVSVDRPGYGYSDFGHAEPDLARQADLVAPLLTPGTVVVGHSYGGTLAVRLAMDHPDLVGALVLVAPSLSPEHERIFFFNRPMERKALNWTMSRSWKVSNTEKLAQVGNLEAMALLWPRITAPVSIIHGTRDGLVPLDHSLYAVDRLPEESTNLDILEGESHFILWSEIDRVAAAILNHL